jgi:hypothetical protein
VLDLEEQSFLMRSTRQIRFPAQVVFMAGAAKQTSFWAGRFQLFMAGEAKQAVISSRSWECEIYCSATVGFHLYLIIIV